MDEHREESEELAAIARDDADDARQYWAEVRLAFQTSEADAWDLLGRSSVTVGSVLGETLIESVDIVALDWPA